MSEIWFRARSRWQLIGRVKWYFENWLGQDEELR